MTPLQRSEHWELHRAEDRVHELEAAIRSALQSDLALTNDPREALACRDSVIAALRRALDDEGVP